MARHSRIVISNNLHHVTQIGNYQQRVFESDEHFRKYCAWMNEYAEHYGLKIVAYCLMSNHVHFIVIPPRQESLSKVFNTVHMRYAHYINRLRGMKGHLWQGRFYSCILDEAHVYRAIRYVETNPVRAKIVTEAKEYEWSSAREHLGLITQGVIKISTENAMINKYKWEHYLREEDFEMKRDIEEKTSRGLVVGNEAFVKMLEVKLGRSLKCLGQGRPRKYN